MNICSKCSNVIDGGEKAIFAGFTLFREDRTQHEDTILLHAECCDTELLEVLEDHLTNY